MRRSPEGAQAAKYRAEATRDALRMLDMHGDRLPLLSDLVHGFDYLARVDAGDIKDNDTVLILSLDGAQLYANKVMDFWMYIHLGGFIPKKPQNIDSFVFPGIRHVAALMRKGLRLWDAERAAQFLSDLFLLFAMADIPGMAYLNISLRAPLNMVEASHHYAANLTRLMGAKTQREYAKLRLETGIAKPSILMGLPARQTLGIPNMFPADIMHHGSLNIPDLQLSLFRRTIQCDKNNNKASWDWATLITWKKHGTAVAVMTPYLPGSFGQAPHNPAEKISSGYKAYSTSGLLAHFTKMVSGYRMIAGHEIASENLVLAHGQLVTRAEEFEKKYYQRKPERLHFVRQSVHGFTHYPSETERCGPYANFSQWTLERTIGNLGGEVRQHSNPFANLAEQGYADAESMHCEQCDGYSLRRAKDKTDNSVTEEEAVAIIAFLDEHNIPMDNWEEGPSIVQWARLVSQMGRLLVLCGRSTSDLWTACALLVTSRGQTYHLRGGDDPAPQRIGPYSKDLEGRYFLVEKLGLERYHNPLVNMPDDEDEDGDQTTAVIIIIHLARQRPAQHRL
ncbi:uncharacterized protein B0H18DRAFT_1124953 [Fomitopsis serialis]|uniref:uncharacterized protein n=1 Tax=Fomitopsis serialis TaxID=139415 RepID=UPI002008C850|nr:uncharacterized protein B0H18DRAFT_1124953 [Neoantrodia serialis]KAH9915364.1 hypothetical protein B0H18DRAFT_1124953 [Neoantrodia serialis]